MSITDPELAESMRRHLGERLTPAVGSLDEAPLELMAVSPAEGIAGFGRGLWHLYSVHGRTLGRFGDRHETAALLERCVVTLAAADSSPFLSWMDAIAVNGRNDCHVVDPQVLNSPTNLMRAIRRRTLDLDEPMFARLVPADERSSRGRQLHLVEPSFGTSGAEPADPAALSQAEVAWSLAKMAWLAAVRLWPADADPTVHCQSLLDSIGQSLSTIDGGWRHHSAESLTAWLARHG